MSEGKRKNKQSENCVGFYFVLELLANRTDSICFLFPSRYFFLFILCCFGRVPKREKRKERTICEPEPALQMDFVLATSDAPNEIFYYNEPSFYLISPLAPSQ